MRRLYPKAGYRLSQKRDSIPKVKGSNQCERQSKGKKQRPAGIKPYSSKGKGLKPPYLSLLVGLTATLPRLRQQLKVKAAYMTADSATDSGTSSATSSAYPDSADAADSA